MKKLIILSSLLFSFSLTQAQKMADFSQDTGMFITELDAVFGIDLAENETSIYNAFKLNWDQFDISSQNEIMGLCELMRSRRFKARPHFIRFLGIINVFHAEDNMSLGYNDWMKGYSALLESEGLTLDQMDIIQASTQQILNTDVLFSSRSVTWKIQKKNRIPWDGSLLKSGIPVGCCVKPSKTASSGPMNDVTPGRMCHAS